MDNSDQTLLHSAVKTNNLEAAELLLRQGVNIHLKNEQGLTPLFILVQERVEKFDSMYIKENETFTHGYFSVAEYRQLNLPGAEIDEHLMYRYKRDQKQQKKFEREKEESLNEIRKQINMNEQFITLLLKHGSSHDRCPEDIRLLNFIAACTLQNSSIAEDLAGKMDNINQSINVDSPTFAGYTALHFASLCNVNIVKMLVSKGVSLLVQDVKGVTPFETCIKLHCIEEIQSILKSVPAWKDILFSDRKTKLMDYISVLHDPKHHAEFLQHLGDNIRITLSKNSPLWPGYTVLHIAVILSFQNNLQIFKDILSCSTTILKIQDIHGMSALHLAFRLNKLKLIELIFKLYKKPVNASDKDHLTHLHIAVSINNQTVVKKLLEAETAFDVAYTGDPLTTVKHGWTPLHIAAYTKHAVIATILLARGANLLQKDTRGFTAIHLLFGRGYSDGAARCFFAINQLKECILKDCGLTHLHVASWKCNIEAIERLLNLGSDIEATIGKLEDKKLAKYEGYRPIHLAMMSTDRSCPAYKLLLQRGADILAKKLDGTSPLSDVLTSKNYDYFFKPTIDLLRNSEELQKRILKETGITMLHIACYEYNSAAILKELKNGADVNARVREDSTIWPGYTPMHVIIFKSHANSDRTTSFLDDLLAKGADATLPNADGDTLALMAIKSCPTVFGNIRASNILKHQMNFKINYVNKAGMSHFHIACLLNNAGTVKNFLEHIKYINVNQQIDVTDKSKFAGYTPLLLALSHRPQKNCDAYSQTQLVNLLLELGADVHAINADGYTALHKVATCKLTRECLFPKLLIDNADINKQANDGKTLMEIMLTEGAPTDQIQYLVNQGARINSYNPVSNVGYMAIVIESEKYRKSFTDGKILGIMKSSPDISEVSDSGRNAIHNLVAIGSKSQKASVYIKWIKELMSLGCEISQQDDQGRTPLHLAINFQNCTAVKALLFLGADINVVDMNGKSPFSYVSQSRLNKQSWILQDSSASICKILATHLRKHQLVGIQVSKLNAKLLREFMTESIDINIEAEEHELTLQLDMMKEMKMCSRGFTVRDFLYPTGVVNLYSSLKQADRDAIDSFFNSTVLLKVPLWIDLLKLQYTNATQRMSLIKPAVIGLKTLLGFPFPDLCIDIVLKYLINSDLKNVTAAASIP